MGMRQKAESGQGLLGFRVPYGYRLREGMLHVDETEARVVRSIYDGYLAGQTMEMIAWGLNRDGETTRTGGEWTVWSIGRILHNPVYAGYLRWEDLVNPSEHLPIIDVATFNKVQIEISGKVKNKKHAVVKLLPETGRGSYPDSDNGQF
jgi:hypothetical protein